MLEFSGAPKGGGLQGGCRATARKYRKKNSVCKHDDITGINVIYPSAEICH